jgi:glycosyltransferase involved in cell wall biosynthesis
MIKKPEQGKRRLFLVEPTFVLKVGHVSQCTYLFAKQAKELNFDVVIIVPENAPFGTPIEKDFELLRVLPNTYDSFLIEGLNYRYNLRILVLIFSVILGKRLRRKMIFLFDRLNWYIEYRLKSKKVWSAVNSKYSFTEKDRFIFPNADHLTTKSLLKYLRYNSSKDLPSVGLRFINVMENNGIPKLQNSGSLFRFLQRSKSRGFKIDVTAETDGYRAYIGQFVTGVSICEYPQNLEISKKQRNQTESRLLTLGSLGSARPDKGFGALDGLIPRLLAFKDKEIEILIQEATQSWGYEYETTLTSLRNYSQIKFLPGYLTQEEMNDSIKKCDVLLMPYDVDTYQFRGSAMLFEAADLEIPMIVPSKTGLGEVVRKYGLGATFNDEADVLIALKVLLQIDSKTLKNRFSSYNLQRQKNFDKLILG